MFLVWTNYSWRRHSTGGGDERSLPSSPCPGRLLGATLIHLSAWKRNSANFAFTEFSEVRWAAPGEYDVLVTWATRGRVPRVGRREQGSNPPTFALGRPPPQERLAADPPDGRCRLPRLVSGRPHPRAGAAHLRPDSGSHRAGAGGGGAPPACTRADPRGRLRGRDSRPPPVRLRCRGCAGRGLRGAGDGFGRVFGRRRARREGVRHLGDDHHVHLHAIGRWLSDRSILGSADRRWWRLAYQRAAPGKPRAHGRGRRVPRLRRVGRRA